MIVREGRNYVPRAADRQKGMPPEIGGNRDIMRVVGRTMPVRMAGMRFLGPTVVMVVAVIIILIRQHGMTLDFGKGESGRIMGCRVTKGCQQQGECHREGKRETKNPAVLPIRHDQ